MEGITDAGRRTPLMNHGGGLAMKFLAIALLAISATSGYGCTCAAVNGVEGLAAKIAFDKSGSSTFVRAMVIQKDMPPAVTPEETPDEALEETLEETPEKTPSKTLESVRIKRETYTLVVTRNFSLSCNSSPEASRYAPHTAGFAQSAPFPETYPCARTGPCAKIESHSQTGYHSQVDTHSQTIPYTQTASVITVSAPTDPISCGISLPLRVHLLLQLGQPEDSESFTINLCSYVALWADVSEADKQILAGLSQKQV